MAKIQINLRNSLLLEDFFLLWSNLMLFCKRPKMSQHPYLRAFCKARKFHL